MEDTADISGASLRYRWLVFAILATVYLAVYFQRQAPAVLSLDLKNAISLDGSSLGFLTAAFFYSYAAMQIPAGIISRMLGPRRALCVFFLLASLGTILFGLAESFPVALAARVLVGLGVAMVLVPMLDILAAWFTPREFGKMVGLVLAVGGVGLYAGADPLAHLDALVGWRKSFLLTGMVSLVLTAMAWLFVKDRPFRDLRRQLDSGAAEAAEEPGIGSVRAMKLIAANRAFWAPAMWAFFAMSIFTSFGSLWGGPYLMHVYGLSKIETGHVLSMQAAGMIVGGPALVWAAENVVHSRRIILIFAGATLLLLTVLLACLPAGLSLFWLYVWFFIMSMTSMAAVPLALLAARSRFAPSVSGMVTGMFNFFSVVGGAIAQPVVGWLLDLNSGGAAAFAAGHYTVTFWMYALFACCTTGAALLVVEPAAGSGDGAG